MVNKQWAAWVFVVLVGVCGRAMGQSAEKTLDDVLKNPGLVQSIKTVGLAVLSQADPVHAQHDAQEVRKTFWAARPEAKLTKDESELALKDFDRSWQNMAAVVRKRKIHSVHFVGMDLVLLKRSLDWYYGAATPQGPVLIRISVQYNDEGPMTMHGVRVWSEWDEVKAVVREIDMKAESKVLTIVSTPQTSDQAEPKPADDPRKE